MTENRLKGATSRIPARSGLAGSMQGAGGVSWCSLGH